MKSTRRQADVCLRPSSPKNTASTLIPTTTSQFVKHDTLLAFASLHTTVLSAAVTTFPPYSWETVNYLWTISTKGYSDVFQTQGHYGHYIQHVLVCEASTLHAAHKMDRSTFNDHCISSTFVPQSRELLPVGGSMLFLEHIFDSLEEITRCIIWC